ncbi:MAG TPA: hypothetical protein VGM19_00100 [Armatimonadota bacterium]|jgi:hypothetical protein
MNGKARVVMIALLLSLLLTSLLVAGVAAQAPPQPIVSILEKDGNPKTGPIPEPPYLELLAKQGLIVGYSNPQAQAVLDWESLRKYNVLVMLWPPEDAGYSPLSKEDGQQQAALVERFLQEGGGVLVFAGMHVGDSYDVHVRMNNWLKQYGAQFAWKVTDDPTHLYKTPPPVPWQRPEYLITTNFAASPITAGVKTLFLPHDMFWVPSISPLELSGDWQTIVSTEPTATTWDLPPQLGGGYPAKIPGTEKTGAAPIIAVRQVGKGRLAICGAQASALWFDLGKPVGAQVASVKGDGQRTSDWLPLLRNLAVWLSEPGRAAGKPGGTTERVSTYINPEYGSRTPIDWDRPDISWPDSEIYRLYSMHAGPFDTEYFRAAAAGQWHSYKFLVGAHTAASGGKGTVADWKAAAIKAGYNGVVFRELILQMTKEQWTAFEAECKAASDSKFLALPGQEYTDWIGQRFMRYYDTIPYPNAERLTPDRKLVKDQLSFFFDAGWPAHFPLTPQKNATAYWNYRVYSCYPVAVYQGGKLIEDNRPQWHSLVDRMEYPTPIGVHLLEDPAEVAGTVNDWNLTILAPSLTDVETNPRWHNSSIGTGQHNIAVSTASNGPEIQAFLPLNHYRATVGGRDVAGTYRYRILVRARSTAPIDTVEVWGGGQLLRRWHPHTTNFLGTMEEEHARQRGMLLRVVDDQGREALASAIMVHDKMMEFVWCGDHCNALPYGQGMTANGSPTGLGLVTHVKGAWQQGGGPGGSFAEAMDYIPSGTDTSFPSLNLFAQMSFATDKGRLPAANVDLMSDNHFWYANRDLLVHRMNVDTWADLDKYVPKEQPTINGWYPYVLTAPMQDFTVQADDMDFHRDSGQPAFQMCRGQVTFKHAVTLNDKEMISVLLSSLGWNSVKEGMYMATGKLAEPGSFSGKLGKGNYISWPAALGNGTIFALDDDFAVTAAVDATGKQNGMPNFGYSLGKRSFRAGEVFKYSYLIMRWPVGTTMADRLDAKAQVALNLARADSGAHIAPQWGRVLGTQFVQSLEARDHSFRGVLAKGDFGMRIPVRVTGLNENWTAAVWQAQAQLLEPFGNDPEGWAWTSVDPVTQAGPIFLGNVLTCNESGVLLRLLQRTNGGWDVIAHNPLGRTVNVRVRGTEGGPAAGLDKRLTLTSGQEVRWTVP